MKLFVKIGLIIFFLLQFTYTFSQDIHFDKVLDGSVTGVKLVSGISQDKKGYIWISTSAGFRRYDGSTFKTFYNKTGNGDETLQNALTCLSIDSAGNIWGGTFGKGILKLQPSSNSFTSFYHDPKDPSTLADNNVLCMMTDHLGNVWVGTFNGLDKFDQQTKKFIHYAMDKGNTPAGNTIFAIHEDQKHSIWVSYGTYYLGNPFFKRAYGGLNRMDATTGKFTNYFSNDEGNKLAHDIAYSILVDNKDDLWLGFEQHELQMLDKKTSKFNRFPYDAAMPEDADTAISELILFITQDKTGAVWSGTFLHGLARYDPFTHKKYHYGSLYNAGGGTSINQDSTSGFENDDAVSGFCSNDGVMWIGTNEGDLYKAVLSRTNIPYFNLQTGANSFYQENDSIVWIATSAKGLDRRNVKTGKDTWITDKNGNLEIPPEHDVTGLRADNFGNLWISSFSGIYKRNLKNGVFSRYTHDALNKNSLLSDSIQCIDIENHNLWIGTFGYGLDRMDLVNESIEHFVYNKDDSSSISNNFINVITSDKKGNVWIGTFKGLNRLDKATHKFTHYLKSSEVISISVNSRDEIWVGTTGSLYYFDAAKNRFSEYVNDNSQTKLANVLHILEDNQQNLWLTTSNSIIKIDRQQDKLNAFGKNYGVHFNNFYDGDNYKLANGQLLIGDQNGFYVVSPAALHVNSTIFLNYTSFKINDKEILTGQRSVNNTEILNAKEINLNYKQNTFSFDFNATDYTNTGNTKYLYMLENYDNTWRDIGAEHKAYFFNVPPGKYVMRARAINEEGVSVTKSISIIISPPWWKTWWAYTIFLFIFITAIWTFIQYRSIQLRRENRMLEEKVNQRTGQLKTSLEELKATQAQLIQSEKMASLGQLTAGIAHEIQNPLNFMNNFSEVNNELIEELSGETEKGKSEMESQLLRDIYNNNEKIIEHGKRADAIVKNMLEHSRQGTGQKQLTDINALADEYLKLAYHGIRAKDKSFNAALNTDFDQGAGTINVTPQDIGRVLLNLYNNAFYAVREKHLSASAAYEPDVSVTTRKNGDQMTITVKDNGNGIPQNIVDKIFQPFFTTKPTGQGTGLGLSLAYDIVKAHGGEIKVLTKEGEGSSFMVELPSN
jgi:signal transduction histidine kinase/ligand-binding sensor domain-containing protein